jgi:hypothetical protein
VSKRREKISRKGRIASKAWRERKERKELLGKSKDARELWEAGCFEYKNNYHRPC